MAKSIKAITAYAVQSTKANQLYLASLGEYLHEHDEHDDIRAALEASGRDWYSDKMIAVRGWTLVEDTGLSCPAMWAKGFLNDLRTLAESIGETESETFRLGIKTFGQDLKAKDLRNWTPESEDEDKPKRDAIEEAIACLKANAEDPRVIAFLRA